ncbi:MAG: pilin, partial [Patescibacteria group bacterium]|nr:pilin [Patescibacteria group bacterium]
MLKKIAFYLCLFLFSAGLFLVLANPVLADDLRGKCVCSGCPIEDGDVEYLLTAADRTELGHECIERCTNPAYILCESGSIPSDPREAAIACVNREESYNTVLEICEPTATITVDEDSTDIRGTCNCTICAAAGTCPDFSPTPLSADSSYERLLSTCQKMCEDRSYTTARITDLSCVSGATPIDNSCAPPTVPTPPSSEKSYDAIPIRGISVPTPLGDISIPELIGKIIKAVLGIVGSIALLMFIYGGFLWLMSGGNEKNITKGR